MSCCNSSSSSESKRCVCSRAICDGALLFLARSLRLAAYGWAGVALYKYLAVIGLSNGDVGLLLTLILVGDLLMSLLVTTRADRCGRRASLVLGTLLMIGAGIAFAFSTNLYVLAVAGVVGVISPTGGEIGPFLAVEQAALTQLVETGKITTVFAVYNLVGSLSIAAGALIGGAAIDWLLANAFATADAYRAALIAYSVLACSMVVAYALLSKRVEPPPTAPELDVLRDSATPPGKSGHWFCFQGGMACARPTVASVTGLKARSTQIVVAKMCALFIIDACGAGFVMQSMISFWLNERWAVDATLIGVVLMSCNIAAGVSALLAAPLAKKIGLVNTMVFTHIPSNLFLVAVPLMPSAVLAMACIVGRFTISQMDVPARQAFVVLVVPADERAAASGITTVTRSIGLAISPLISGVFLAHTENSYLFGASFFCGAGLMMLYDVLLWFALRRVQVAGETTRTITTTVNDVEELPTDDGVPSIHASQRSDLKNFLETYIMIWVNRWCNSGISYCRERFDTAMNVLRFEQHGHRGVPQGYKTPEIVHWVFLCNYKEDLSVIRASLNALSLQSIGAHRICILMGCEGAEKGALEKIMPLAAEFPEFRKFVVNVHYLQPGEFAGKSANCSSAFRSLCAGAYHATHDERLHAISGELEADYQHCALDREPYEALLERGMLTMMDADSIFHPFHFYALEQSYHFDRHLTRNQTIWQAPICNFMNLYSIPAPSRLMSMAVTLHEMASLMHPTRQKLPFSTYTVSATLALSMGGWASDVLCDEWHCYERVFFATRGKCAIAATHYPILCYGVQEDTWWKSVKARFTQAKRHSWAAIESACLFSFWSSVPDHHRPAFLDFFSVFWKMWKLHWVGVMQSSTAVGSAIFQMISMSSGYNMWLIPDGFWNVVAWAIFALVSLLLSVLPIVAIASWYITIRYERLVQQQYREALAWMPMGNLAKRIRARSVAELPTAEPPPPPQPLPTSMPTVDNSSASGGGDKRKVKDETRALLIDIDEPRSDAPFENVDVDAVSNMNTTISPTTTTPATTTTTTTISARYRTPEVPNDTHGFDRQPPLIPADVQQYIDEFLIMPPSTTWQRAKLLFEAIVIMPIASVMYGFLPALIAQSMLPFKRYYTFVVAAKPKKEELIY